MSAIADLLMKARLAHQRYREHVTRKDGAVKVLGDEALAGAALFDACRLRTEARYLDPQRLDPAWASEPATHDDDQLLTFYAEQLSR